MKVVVVRLRAVQRERLELQDRLERMTPTDMEKHSGLRYTCILESLSEQSVSMMSRAHLIRRTLFCLLCCIAWLVACSLLSGITVVWAAALGGAIACFVLGMLFLLAAVACALLELNISLSPAELEIGVVSELTGFSTGKNAIRPTHSTTEELLIP